MTYDTIFAVVLLLAMIVELLIGTIYDGKTYKNKEDKKDDKRL